MINTYRSSLLSLPVRIHVKAEENVRYETSEVVLRLVLDVGYKLWTSREGEMVRSLVSLLLNVVDTPTNHVYGILSGVR